MSRGTPKTLSQAIQNCEPALSPEQVESVLAHVRDFLAQRFGSAMMTDDETVVEALKNLWDELTGETEEKAV